MSEQRKGQLLYAFLLAVGVAMLIFAAWRRK